MDTFFTILLSLGHDANINVVSAAISVQKAELSVTNQVEVVQIESIFLKKGSIRLLFARSTRIPANQVELH